MKVNLIKEEYYEISEIPGNTMKVQSDKKVDDTAVLVTDKQQSKNVTTDTKEDPENKATDLK